MSLNYENINAGLKWELDLWGRIRRSIEAARAQLLSKVENQRVVILSLVSGVAESYIDLRALDYQADIARRTLKACDESVRISKLRYEQGDVPKLDLDRFVAERAGAAAQLADLERQVVQRENQLSVLLGHRKLANYNPDHPFIRTMISHGGKNVEGCVPLYNLHFSYNRELAARIEKEYGIPAVWLPFGFDLDESAYERIREIEEIHRIGFEARQAIDRAAANYLQQVQDLLNDCNRR